ncbi:MAG TPA: ABC transporter ATP-binding protein [Firmicutes bacterium]|nr:ABC transporter ATP-binding protein [Bacillota bacterium]HHY99112.1 ABC transporter ATP-binding protein [Bacillota bacterium]
MNTPLIEVEHVSKYFRWRGREVRAVNNVSFSISEGEIVCLVGESGCGKTTTGKMTAGLLPPSAGRLLFEGKEVWSMKKDEFRRYRKSVQIIHQDPYASLNPVHTIYRILSAPLLRHRIVKNHKEALAEVQRLLETVGLTPPEEFLNKYPHQLSGGQRQRVSVARALTVQPRFIVADEAVSMVDVSIRVSLLNLLTQLKREMGVTFLFITHDLALAKYFAWEGRIGVMYLGQLVEIATTPDLIEKPLHPYTSALISAIPEADPEMTRSKQRVELRSLDIPSLLNLPPGCTFHPRCPYYEEGLCNTKEPELVEIEDGHQVSCHMAIRGRVS